MHYNRTWAAVLGIAWFLWATGVLKAQNSGITSNNSVTTSLASATAATPAGTGAAIEDCLPETFMSNPIPPNGGGGGGPYFRINFCKGTWVTQLPIVIDTADEVIGAGKPNISFTSSGTLIRADPGNFPVALAPPPAPTLAAATGTTGLAAGTYIASITYLVSLNSAGQTSIAISSLTCSSGTVTVTTATAHNFIAGQVVTLTGVSPTTYDGAFSAATVPTTTTFTFSVSSCSGPGTGGTVSGSSAGNNDSLALQDTLPSPTQTVMISATESISVSGTPPSAGGSCVTGCGTTYHASGLSAVGFVSYITSANGSQPYLRNPTSCTGTGATTITVASTAIGCSMGATAVFAPSSSFANSGTHPPLVNRTNPVVVLGSSSLGDSSSRFGVQLRDLGIDCSGIAGIGVYDAAAQERSGVFYLDVINTAAGAYTNANSGGCLQADLYWRGPGAQNSSIVSASPGSGGGSGSFTNYSPYIPIIVDGRNGEAARQIRDISIAPYSVTNNQYVVSEGIYLTGANNAGMDLSVIHCEAMEACVTVDNSSRPVIHAVTAATTIGGAVIHLTSAAGPVELHDIRGGAASVNTLQDDNVGLVTLTSTSTPAGISLIQRGLSASNVGTVTANATQTFSVTAGELFTVSGVTGGTTNFNGRFVVCGAPHRPPGAPLRVTHSLTRKWERTKAARSRPALALPTLPRTPKTFRCILSPFQVRAAAQIAAA